MSDWSSRANVPGLRATRRRLAGGAAALVAVAAAAARPGATARRRTAPSPDEHPRVNAFIQRTTDRSAMVRVAATDPVRVEVCISEASRPPDPERCDRRFRSATARRNHRILVPGLRQDTTYAYRVTNLPAGDGGEPVPERPSKVPGVIRQASLRSAPEDDGGAAIQIDAGPQVVALATVAGARWETSVYGNGRLDYQEEAAADGALTLEQQFELPRYANRKLADALTADHRVCIGPLRPETIYRYSVTSVAGVTPATSREKRFATLPDTAAPPGDFAAARRFPLGLEADGLAPLPGGALLAWSRTGETVLLGAPATGLAVTARWNESGRIGGAATAPDGRIFLSLPGPANGAGLATAIVRVYLPDPAAPTGYAAAADLGPLIGAPGALALDSSGNLAALTTLTGEDGIPEAQFNLFDADPVAPGGFTLRFALLPYGQATAMAGTAGGSILLLAANRAIVALAGDIHDPDGAVSVWDGRSAGLGPWIEAAAIASGPGGDLYLVDGCTGSVQAVAVDPVSGAFSAVSAGNTRDLLGGLTGAPIALAVDRGGSALILERGAGGARAVVQFRRTSGAAPAGRKQTGQPLDPARWRPRADSW